MIKKWTCTQQLRPDTTWPNKTDGLGPLGADQIRHGTNVAGGRSTNSAQVMVANPLRV